MSLTARQFFFYYRKAVDLIGQRQRLAFEASLFPYLDEHSRRQMWYDYGGVPKLISSKEEVEKSWEALRAGKVLYDRKR